jgi:DNA mismatch repair protein MutH
VPNQVVNLRTGELETCHVGAGCKRHSHDFKFPQTTNIKSISSLIDDENELTIKNQNTIKNQTTVTSRTKNNSIIGRLKNIFTTSKKKEAVKHAARQALLKRAESIIGMTGHEINALQTFSNTKGENLNNKGHLGNVIQENVFGLPANSTAEPDFTAEGLELKVIGVKKKRNGEWAAKDRMVANIIDFETEDTTGDITKSSFWKKNQRTLVIMYESVHKDKLANKIVGAFILDLNSHEHLGQIQKDYKVINDKIRTGKAETISGKDTHFLEACTKGEGHGRDLRNQRGSTTQAKQRAYAFKPRFMSPLINAVLSNAKE